MYASKYRSFQLVFMVGLLVGCAPSQEETMNDEQLFTVPAPSSCEEGECSKPRVELLSGQLSYGDQNPYDDGFVLNDDGSGPPVLNSCRLTLGAQSVALVRVTAEVEKLEGCPRDFRVPSERVSLEVVAVVGGHAIPNTMKANSVKDPQLHTWDKDSMYLINLREINGEWFTFNSVPVDLVNTALTTGQSEQYSIDLPSDLSALAASVEQAYKNYGDQNVCPEHLPWRSDADVMAFLKDDSECHPTPADDPAPAHPGEDG